MKQVLKFGGSSVAHAAHIRKVIQIVLDRQDRGPALVVVSALGGVTDVLPQAMRQPQAQNFFKKRSPE